MKLLRDPLLHFLLIGVGLFVVYGWLHPGADARARIVVSEAQVAAIAAQFQGSWQRPPSRDELRGLVDSWVSDEILYREGEALGLQRDDPVVKRRIRQIYTVMAEESLPWHPPSDVDLATYLADHVDSFRQPGRVSFEQVLVVPSGSVADGATVVVAARQALVAGADPGRVGQPTMLPARSDDVALDAVARDFGESFAKHIESVPLEEWAGPVESGFGMHLVRVSARSPGTVPSLEEVRSAVAREWESARRQDSRAARLRDLRQRYEVIIEADLRPEPAARMAAQ